MVDNEDIKVNAFSLHRIDVQSFLLEHRTFNGDEGGLKKFAVNILSELLVNSRSRSFTFRSMGELVASSLVAIMNGASWEENAGSVAKKLYDTEIEVQERIKNLKAKVRKGGLLQIKLKHEGSVKFVIVKIDDDDFFDEIELEFKSGLPVSKGRLQKAAIISFSENGDFEEMVVSESKSAITEYWYNRFLEAVQLTDSETNTKNAFNAIDKFLVKEVKAISSIDYWFIRNDVVSYFRNENLLSYDDLVNKVKSHKPESDEFKEKFDSFVEKLSELPRKTKGGFDTQFDIVANVISAKIRRSVILDENFELRFKGEVEDLKSRVTPGIDEKGKFIRIYSDRGYDEFSKSRS